MNAQENQTATKAADSLFVASINDHSNSWYAMICDVF